METNINNFSWDEMPATALEPIMPHCAVALVLDTSHSMYKGTALDDLHRSLAAFVGSVGENAFRGAAVDVAAVGMGDDLRVLEGFRPLASSGLGRLRIRPKGDSPLGGALRLALDCIDAKQAAYRAAGLSSVAPNIIVLSDGISTDSCAAELAEVRRRVASGALCVHAIALGPDADRAALAALAGANVLDPFGADMSGAFAHAGRDLVRRYERAAAYSFGQSAPKASPDADYFRSHFFCIDGTNMLFWNSRNRSAPQLDIVLAFARELKARGAGYRVFFDASTRHLLREKGCPGDEQRYMQILARRPDRFVQTPPKNQADPYILMDAENRANSVVVSQDCFRDRHDIFPWVRDHSRWLTGMVLDGVMLIPDIGLRIPVGKWRANRTS